MLRDLLKRWFDLTLDERRALIFVLALFLLGLIARTVMYRNQQPDPLPAGDVRESTTMP